MSIDVRPPSGVFHPGYHSGEWYGGPAKAVSNVTPAVGTLSFFPIIIYRPMVITDIGVEIVTAATGAQSGRLGLYSDLNGTPNALLLEGTSTIDLTQTPTGYASGLASNISVPAGLVWFAFENNSPAATGAVMRAHNSGANNSGIIGSTTIAGCTNSGAAGGYSMAHVYGTLPATTSSLSKANQPVAGAVKAA